MQRWKNFDIELFDHDTVGNNETVKVRVARSPAGVQRDPITVSIPNTLRSSVKVLAKDVMSLDETLLLGQELSRILLPNEANELFVNSRAQLEDGEGLRIRIELRSLALADLPWEYSYLRPADFDSNAPERGFLALDRMLSLVRYEPVAQPPGSCRPLKDQQIQVAMLLANPDIPGWSKLDLDSEVKVVESALSDEPGIVLSSHHNATTQTLNDCLDSRPHVFHFAGHGRFKMRPSDEFGVYVGQGELLFENQAGSAEPVPAQDLASKMRGSGVRLAVLNNCESAKRDALNAFTGVAPTLVRDGVPAVVAMQFNISDQHALVFARRLYHNLADHQSIDDSVTAARIAMFNHGGNYTRDWGIPVLYLRSEQAVLFPDENSAEGRWPKFGVREILNIGLSTLLLTGVAILYWLQIEPRLPMGGVIGGVIVAAAMIVIGFLNYIAGEPFRRALLHWYRKRLATGILIAATVCLVGGFLLLPKPISLHILPGTSLLNLLPNLDNENPLRRYQLRVVLGEQIFVSDNFTKSGVVIADSESLAKRLSQRYAQRRLDKFETYFRNENIDKFKDRILIYWQQATKIMKVIGLGRAEQIVVSLEYNGEIKSCKVVEINTNNLVVMLEKKDEC